MKLAVPLHAMLVACLVSAQLTVPALLVAGEVAAQLAANPPPPEIDLPVAPAACAPSAVLSLIHMDKETSNAGGPKLAVVRLIQINDEASNAGGVHFTFEVDEPGPPRFVHGGGHEFAFVAPGGDRWSAMRCNSNERDLTPTSYYIAEITPSVPFRIRDPGWALGQGLRPPGKRREHHRLTYDDQAIRG